MGCGYNCGLENVVASYNTEIGNSGYLAQGYGGGIESSGIDYLVEAETREVFDPGKGYENNIKEVKKEVYNDGYRNHKKVTESYSHVIDDFLNPQRQSTAFIGDASEVRDFVEETFKSLTGREFPEDVSLKIVPEKEIKKMHLGNVMGFAINRKRQGLISEIFVKKCSLDKMMLTTGHELGHVLTEKLPDKKDEEAKAFAFSLAWMKKIKEENIGNLSTAIRLDSPAENGIHNTALDFVLDLINKGREALDVWMSIVKKEIKINSSLDKIEV